MDFLFNKSCPSLSAEVVFNFVTRLFFNRAVMSQLFFERVSVKQLDSIPLRIFGMFLTSEQIDNDEHQRSKIFVKKRQSLKDRVLAHQSTRAPKSVERARLRLRVS